MTHSEAIDQLVAAAEDEDMSDDAADLFAAIYGRKPITADGDAGALISMCYADPDVARVVEAISLLEIGDRVEGGKAGTDEHDAGEVVEIDGSQVTVRWDSLQTTKQRADVLRLEVSTGEWVDAGEEAV